MKIFLNKKWKFIKNDKLFETNFKYQNNLEENYLHAQIN